MTTLRNNSPEHFLAGLQHYKKMLLKSLYPQIKAAGKNNPIRHSVPNIMRIIADYSEEFTCVLCVYPAEKP